MTGHKSINQSIKFNRKKPFTGHEGLKQTTYPFFGIAGLRIDISTVFTI